MDREELVQQILKQVLAKLTDMGEKADAACVRPDAVCPAAHKPGLLILTQEHGVDCHAKLEDPRLQERYGTQCALIADYAVDIADVEVVILYQLSIEALCKLSSGLCDTPYTRLAQRAILSGKRIYVPTQEVELLQNNTMPAAYRAMLQKKLELLEACGLRICPQQTLVDAILPRACCWTGGPAGEKGRYRTGHPDHERAEGVHSSRRRTVHPYGSGAGMCEGQGYFCRSRCMKRIAGKQPNS